MQMYIVTLIIKSDFNVSYMLRQFKNQISQKENIYKSDFGDNMSHRFRTGFTRCQANQEISLVW